MIKKRDKIKIVFLIYRIGYYRYFTPLIREGLTRGYDVECWHDYSAPKGGEKGFAFPSIEDVPVFNDIKNKIKTKTFFGIEKLENKLMSRNDIDIVVSIHFPGVYPAFKFMDKIVKSRPFKWFTLMSSAPDSFFELVKILDKNSGYRFKEPFFVFSKRWLEMGKEYLQRYFPKHFQIVNNMKIKFMIVGTPEFDLFNNVKSPQIIRKKYGISENRSILLYLPFSYNNRNQYSSFERAFTGILTNTYISKENEYVHNKKKNIFKNLLYKIYISYKIVQDRKAFNYWIKGFNEAKVFKAVRKFCDRNNLFLVVKPRMKFPLAEIIKRKADLIVWDSEKSQNPPIMKELLSIAKLSVSFFSYSVLTSVFANVPHLNILLPDEYFPRHDNKFWFSGKKYSIFNFPDVCQCWSIEDTIKKLAQTDLNEFIIKKSAKKEYIKMINEFNDFKTSKRFFNTIEKDLFEKKLIAG